VVAYGRIGDIVVDNGGGLTILNVKQYIEHANTEITSADVMRSQVLMEMLGVDKCQFDSPTGVVTIKRDMSVWKDEIKPKLRKFCEYVHSKLGKPT